MALHHPCTLTTRVILTGFKVGYEVYYFINVEQLYCNTVSALICEVTVRSLIFTKGECKILHR